MPLTKDLYRTGVPNLSLTMYPLVFGQVSMYP